MAFDPYYEWLGIPPEEQPPNHYRLLGLCDFEASLKVIENAADRQMLHIRTFHAGEHSEESQDLLNQISQARVCLLSTDSKSEYDASLRASSNSSTAQLTQSGDGLSTQSVHQQLPKVVADARQRTPFPRGLVLIVAGGLVAFAAVLLTFGLRSNDEGEGNNTDPESDELVTLRNSDESKANSQPNASGKQDSNGGSVKQPHRPKPNAKRPFNEWVNQSFPSSVLATLPDASPIDDGVRLSNDQHFYFGDYKDKRNVAVKAHVRFVEGQRCSIFVRVVPGASYYVLSYYGKNRFSIAKLVDGIYTVLKEKHVRVRDNSFYAQLAAHENTITASINGGVVFQLEDDSLSNGQVVISSFQAEAEFTAVQIRSTEGEAPPKKLKLALDTWTPYEFKKEHLARVPMSAALVQDGVRLADKHYSLFIFHEFQSSDLVIEADVHFVDGNNLAINPLVDGSNFYAVIYRGQGQFQFNYNEASEGKILARAKVDSIDNERFRLRTERSGDTYIVSVDGNEIMRVSDNKLRLGSPGISTYLGASEFRNVRFKSAK